MRSGIFLAVTMICVCGLLPSQTNAQISNSIEEIIESGVASEAFWAVVVTDSNGTILENYNGEKLIRPASTFKLVTSSAILNELGPEYTFTTTLYGTGQQQGDRWVGDLLIRGTGDPSISGDFHDGNGLFLFEEWRTLLESMGIDQIDGNIIGNESYFDDVPYPRGWEWDDLSYYYGVEINALSFNNNVVDLEVLANGEIGDIPEIQWFPFNTPYVEFINEQQITHPNIPYDESYRRELGANRIYLRSLLPRGYYETEPLSITKPSLYFIDTFKRYLERNDIRVNGQLITDRFPRNWSDDQTYQVLHEHESVELHRMIRQEIKDSDNFYAEMLLKTLAAETYSVAGSTELGIRAVKEFLYTAGIDTAKTEMRDGSGMAPATVLQARDLNYLLHHIKVYDWFDTFYNSLAIAGVDGTLSYRFRNSPVRSNFRGKTGSMSGVRALTGFLNTSSGDEVTVTMVTNNYTVDIDDVDRLHEQIMEVLYFNY